MAKDENVRDRKRHLRHVDTRRQKVSIPSETLRMAKQADAKQIEQELNADQLAIIFVCQRGRQSLFDITRGVNSTRIPIGKDPIKEKEVQSILNKLEEKGYLSKAEISGQPTWVATTKAKDLEL